MSNNDDSEDDDDYGINTSIWIKEINKLTKNNHYKLDENVFKCITKFKLINDFYNNQSNIEEVLKECPKMLFFVKEQTEELCKIAVSKSGLSLQYVKNQTYDICKLAVYNNAFSLMYVKNKTYDLCEYAVQKNIEIFEYVDTNLQTLELCMLSITCNNNIDQYPFNIQYVRKDLITYDLWKIALEYNGLSIQFMDLDYQTYELCLLAVKNKPTTRYKLILLYIKSEFHTDELIKLNNDKYDYYIKNPKYLIENKIFKKIIKKKIEQCIICHEIKKYYFQYECGHLSCFDCKIENCYYNCVNKPKGKYLKVFKTIPDTDNIYINIDFKE